MKNMIMSFLMGLMAVAIIGADMPQPELFNEAVKAYIYGYPLVLMDLTRQGSVAESAGDAKPPVNQFAHMKKFPTSDFTYIVSPNVDTLYSVAWLDLTEEPIIFHVPDTNDRYYVMQMLDAWTNVFAAPGTRTNSGKEINYAITGPQFKGKLPKGVTRVKSPTNMVWIIGRIFTAGPKDYDVVHALQQKFSLTPLSAWGKSALVEGHAYAVDAGTPPAKQIQSMDVIRFFDRLAQLLKTYPPAHADIAIKQTLREIGIEAGNDLNGAVLTVLGDRLEGVKQAAKIKIVEHIQSMGKKVNGWTVQLNKMGDYGTDYVQRAAVAAVGLGANLVEDAVYPYTEVDGKGQKLNGAHQYSIHFDAHNLPPAQAFWSLTLYNDQHYFAKNNINRYSLGSHSDLKRNADGSIDIIIQHDAPKDTANWLPAPESDFNLILRVYWPKKNVIDRWAPPAIKRVD